MNYTPLLTQLSAQRSGSTTAGSTTAGPTTAGPVHRGLITELGKPLTILEKLQTKNNTASPDATGFIAVGENEGLLFFDSLWLFLSG